MMSYNPKTAIDTEEHGDPFDTLENGLNWFIKEAEKQGYQAQVIGSVSISGITRYAVNQVTQHTDLNNLEFTLKLVKDKKVAQASSTLLNENGFRTLFDDVESNVKRTPEISFYQGLPEPKEAEPVNLFGKEWSIEDRADAVIQAVNAAEEVKEDVIVSGTASSTVNYVRTVTTQGRDVESSSNSNYFKVNTITGPPEDRGYGQEEVYWRYTLPNIEEMSKDATQTAIDTLDLKTMDAKKYEVVLGPQAVSDLMIFILFSTDPTSFHESNSYASDKLGDQIFDDKLTIHDMPRDPKEANLVRSFDIEGVPTLNREFIDKGVLKFIPYDSFYAAKYLDDKNQATGHAFSGGNPFPISASVEPGDRSLEQQISEIDDGLYVKNFWYNRFTKRHEGGLTGLTRNGLYHVKDGEIQGAVRNLRYTESFVNAFGQDNIISLSDERTQYNLANVPSIHLNEYTFTSVAHTKQQLE